MTSLPLGRDWLAAHLPHAGSMNLLDSVVEHDASRLRATTARHRDAAHPLRRGELLPIACAIEYGAQAAAAHGALLAGRASGAGMLVAARAVVFHAERLDDIAGELEVAVEAMGGGESGVIYRFAVSGAGRVLAEGRLTVAFAR